MAMSPRGIFIGTPGFLGRLSLIFLDFWVRGYPRFTGLRAGFLAVFGGIVGLFQSVLALQGPFKGPSCRDVSLYLERGFEL